MSLESYKCFENCRFSSLNYSYAVKEDFIKGFGNISF